MKATIFAIAVAGLAAAHEGHDHDEAPPAYIAPPAYDAPQPSVSLGEPKVFTATPSVSLGEPLTFTATPTVALGPPKYFTESAPTASSTASSCPAPGDKDASGRYSCNPAHSYPDGQYCTLVDGCYFLRVVGPGVSASASVPVSYETKTVSEFTTFCPSPTTFVHSATTYAVTAATTIVIPCPGGCAVTKPVTTAPGTAPAPQPTLSSAVPSVPVSRNGTTTAPPATYTGAANKMLAGGAPLAAAAFGAFFL